MNYLDKIKFKALKFNLELGFSNLVQQKLKLIGYTTSYVKQKQKKMYEKHKGEIAILSNVKPINWQTQKIEGFNNLEKNELIDVNLKPLKYLPSQIPMWMFKLGLSGVWWIINVQRNNVPLSRGQCFDIYESLTILDSIAKDDIESENVNDNWFCAMKIFFRKIVNNGDTVMFSVK